MHKINKILLTCDKLWKKKIIKIKSPWRLTEMGMKRPLKGDEPLS